MSAMVPTNVSQIHYKFCSLLLNLRDLSRRVRVERTGRPPEHPTQTVVQRIVKAAEEEVREKCACTQWIYCDSVILCPALLGRSAS